ncbi:ATPase [Nonomuraea sp. MG754425]|uniref:SRPBCC domain-containing protein n=1 Tax=Nonomuraea sp. MG754425 TaxID=2570319 RepID=UPI001F184CAE|nr:SRPBCC domain-containing protein [Nonomuraea sp. MG754425]MCF6476066.1 ATPase [Nonomuraea sp. MG754425]
MTDTEFVIEPGRQDIVMIRVLDGPPDLVFRVVTDPELIPRWWGPHHLSTRVERMEVAPGGRWRFANVDARGREHFFSGVYHAVVPAERYVRTWEFEGAPEEVALETVTLTALDGGTRYTARSVHPSVEARDAIVKAGGPRGGRESMDRLAALVVSQM